MKDTIKKLNDLCDNFQNCHTDLNGVQLTVCALDMSRVIRVLSELIENYEKNVFGAPIPPLDETRYKVKTLVDMLL